MTVRSAITGKTFRSLVGVVTAAAGVMGASRPARADVIAPSAFANTGGGTSDSFLLGTQAITDQMLIGASQLSTLTAGDVITGVRFRLPATAPSQPASDLAWSDFEITLGQRAPGLPITSPSNLFAANMLNPVFVRDGALTIGASTYPGGAALGLGPAISFNQTNYVYQGGDLVILFSHNAGSGPGLGADATTSAGFGTSFRLLTGPGHHAPGAETNNRPFPIIDLVVAVPEVGAWASCSLACLVVSFLATAGPRRNRRQRAA